jgi:hypothetical protein
MVIMIDTATIFFLKTMKKIALIIYLLISLNVMGQKNCIYKIDTTKILSNENLNSFLSVIQTYNFKISYNKKDIPSFIKKQLDCFTNKFSIANPDEEYQATDIDDEKLPDRKLLFLAVSKDILVMTYLKGGMGESTHILFIQFQDQKIIDLWTGYGSPELKSLQQIFDYIQYNKNKEEGLNMNRIYM